jgi:glutaryl-CoA dehydrogenase
MGFHGVDYYAVDEMFSDEDRLIRDTFRRFVDEELMPGVGRHFRDGTFPRGLPRRLGDLGALGASLTGYGCAGLGPVAYGVILRELERCDSGFRSFASVQGSLVMWPIHTYGSEAQKERWLPAMARGEAIGCFGLTEPDFGSNPAGMRTVAK